MLTTGIHRKVNIPGHSYVSNDTANSIIGVSLKETKMMIEFTLYEQNEMISKQKTAECKKMMKLRVEMHVKFAAEHTSLIQESLHEILIARFFFPLINQIIPNEKLYFVDKIED